LKCPKVIQNLQ